VALVLGRSGTSWYVRQRILSGGLDQPLVTRLVPSAGAAARNMAFIADRQGTTLAAVHPSGLRDETAAYFGRNVFGQLEGASGTGSSSNPETGFTGASTPNQTGGFTYLRNRWYDPQSGRFLTQDPIGLAGGVNLYAYAGNNPVSFSDPYGLCPDRSDPDCSEKVADFKIGLTVGVSYKARAGALSGEISIGASSSGGLRHDRPLPGGGAETSTVGGAQAGITFNAKFRGEGPELHLGPRSGDNADSERLTSTPVEGNGTVSVSGTIPVVWYGPIPVGGVQLEASLNIPAAVRRFMDGINNLTGGE
jgi:RHS repeat-associated protein